MAKKKNNGNSSAETPKSESKKVKKAPLSNTAIRFVGFLVAFLGIMFITTRAGIIGTMIDVLSVFFILWGLYLVSGSIKKLNKDSSDKNKIYLNICIGLIMIVLGILLIVFGGRIQPYFIIIAGCCIGIYGIMMFIRFLCSGRTRKTTFNIVMSILTLITGILVCLLYINQIATVVSGICFVVFGAYATAVGCLEIICY